MKIIKCLLTNSGEAQAVGRNTKAESRGRATGQPSKGAAGTEQRSGETQGLRDWGPTSQS